MIILSFMLIYVFTGIVLINRELFDIPEAEKSHYTLPVEKTIEGSPAEYAKYLKDSLNLKGRISYQKDWKDNWVFHYDFPGNNYQVSLTPAQDTLLIQREQQGRTFFTVAQQIHVLRGYKGGWAYTAWAVMYDLSCLAMIVFAITGIIMWYRIRKNFRFGLCYLSSGIAIPIVIILLFILWK